MIKEIKQNAIPACVELIKSSFLTVAEEFGLTNENAPRFTAFATSSERLEWQLFNEDRSMFAYYDDGVIIGYYSLLKQENGECELNNLCVLPAMRHKRIGEKLLLHAFDKARRLGCSRMNIGIMEENKVLRDWYERYGFIHTGTQKYDFFPFTCGYMYKDI